jgi:hypothetical protein
VNRDGAVFVSNGLRAVDPIPVFHTHGQNQILAPVYPAPCARRRPPKSAGAAVNSALEIADL